MQSITAPLSDQLCEMLRVVLEPSLRDKLEGHYRTGKRLCPKKLLTYVASDYRKDKIWLRRTRRSKRDYRVMIAVDNSMSMTEAGAGPTCITSSFVICKAFERLEIGDFGVCSFGGTEPTVLLPMSKSMTDDDMYSIISNLTFDKQTCSSHDQSIPDLIRLAIDTFNDHEGGSGAAQLLLVLSDARLNKAACRQMLQLATSANITPVLLIIDPLSTIKSLREYTRFTTALSASGNGLQYYLGPDFPFKFYSVVEKSADVPNVVSDILKQWFELETRKKG
eukprot:GHVO01048192.1.p1 GENE.GHVO01048192.1~~GHVO01048192.1.p1  ORF type:complete len:279 (+),score=51.72 GHVO01048192.1:234-1070(+)